MLMSFLLLTACKPCSVFRSDQHVQIAEANTGWLGAIGARDGGPHQMHRPGGNQEPQG